MTLLACIVHLDYLVTQVRILPKDQEVKLKVYPTLDHYLKPIHNFQGVDITDQVRGGIIHILVAEAITSEANFNEVSIWAQGSKGKMNTIMIIRLDMFLISLQILKFKCISI